MDFKLTPGGDLDLSTGDIQLTDDLAQAVAIRLRWFLEEWKLGPSLGLPFFQTILVKNPDLAAVSRVIRAEIMKVSGISGVIDLDVSVDPQNRLLRCSFVAVTTTTTRMEVEVNV